MAGSGRTPSAIGAALVACLVAVLFAEQRPIPQGPPRDLRHEASGTASLSGTVIAADRTKTPLRRATITVTGAALLSPRVAVTDDDGRFVMGGLAAGQYAVAADKTGYLKMNYGATRPSRQGTSIVVIDGQRAAPVTIALPRAGAISGTVTTAAGDPVADAIVSLLGYRYYNGAKRLMNVGGGLTDDRGAYRVYGLTAGAYLVSVEPSADIGRAPTDIQQLTDADVDRALAGVGASAAASAAIPRPASRIDRPLGYAPIFYPGTANSAGATVINLSAGEEKIGMDVRVDLVPVARIDGVVTGMDASTPPLQIMLTPLGAPAPDRSYGYGSRLGPRSPDAQGHFTFAGVPPGEYRLLATTRRNETPARGGGGPPPPSQSLGAFTTLTVNGGDQSVTLALGPGMTMSGRFAFEGTSAPAALPGGRLLLDDMRIDESGSADVYTAAPAADNTFLVSDLFPGEFKISNEIRPGVAPTSGWALKSVVVGGRDLLDAPLTLAPGQSLTDVVATFTDHPSTLTGTLQLPSGLATSDYFIVVFATDRRYWFPNSRRIVSVRPNAAGEYRVWNLPPGEYFVSALTDVEDGDWFDAEFLQALAALSPLRITIRDGEPLRQDLQIRRGGG